MNQINISELIRSLMRALCLLLFTCIPAFSASHYTESMFRRGLYEPDVLVTSAPLFVLITLRDARNGSFREAAIPSSLLLGAIATEYHLEDRSAGLRNDPKALAEQQRKELQIAFAQPGRVFVFRNPRARNNIDPRYTPRILERVRRTLASKNRKEILAAARANESWLHRIYEDKHDPMESFAYRDAVAHALLERGILVGHGDITGGLYVAR